MSLLRFVSLLTLVSSLMIANEIAISQIRLVPAPSTSLHLSPALAVGPQGDFLATWEERTMPPHPQTGVVRVRRFARDAQSLDATSTQVANGERPAVAASDTDFLAAWTNSGSRFGFPHPFSAAGASINHHGLPGSVIPIQLPGISNGDAQVAWNGRDYAVAWTSDRKARVALVKGSEAAASSPTIAAEGFVAALVAIRSEFFLLVRTEATALVLFRLGSDLSVLETRPVANSSGIAAASTDGNELLIVWHEGSSLRGKLMRAEGDTRELSIGGGELITDLAITWTGDHYLLVFHQRPSFEASGHLHAVRVGSDGSAGEVTELTAIPGRYEVAAASNGTNSLVMWTDQAAEDDQVLANVIPRRGPLTFAREPILVSQVAAPQLEPFVLPNPNELMVVWSEAVDSQRRTQIFAARLNKDGTPLGQDVLVSASVRAQLNPKISFNGEKFLVVWWEWERSNQELALIVVAAFLDRNGQPLRGSPIVLGRGLFPEVASDGRNWLVVWESYPNDGQTRAQILGTLVTSAGVEMQPGGFPLFSFPNRQLSPSVAWNGSNYLLVWRQIITEVEPGYQEGIFAVPLDQRAQPINAGARVADLLDHQLIGPSVAWSAGKFLVAWVSRGGTPSRGSGQADELRVARLTATAELLDEPPEEGGRRVSVAPVSESPIVRPTEKGFLIAWWQGRVSVRTAFISPHGFTSGIGHLGSAHEGFDVSADRSALLFFYARHTTREERLGGSSRLFLRILTPDRRRGARPS